MRSSLLRHPLTTIAVGVIATTLLVVPAATAAQKYAPAKDARSFGNSAGGWSGSVDYDGLCIPGLTCPAVTNSYQASGGAFGGGFLQTSIGSLLGVGAVSEGTWVSPSFRFNGDRGRRADRVTLGLSRRADVADLLQVTGNSAEYDVSILNARGNASEIIPPTTLAGAERWTSTGKLPVDATELRLGKRYQIAITTRFVTGAEVIPGGEVGYDEVILKARKTGRPNKPSNQAIDDVAQNAVPKTIVLRRGKVLVPLRCLSRAKGKCKFSKVRAVIGGKRVTSRARARIGAGKKRTVTVRPRGQANRRKIERSRSVRIKGRVKIGGKTRRINKKVSVRVA